MEDKIAAKVIYRDRTTGEIIRKDGEFPSYICMDVMLAAMNLDQGRTIVIAASDELAVCEEILLRTAITQWANG